MKYLKVPYPGRYDTIPTYHIALDKIACWTDHQIYVLGKNYPIYTNWTAEEIESEIKKVEEANDTYINWKQLKEIECCWNKTEEELTRKYVEGATSKENADEPKWEMRLNGISVEPQVKEIKEIWKNCTVEILEMPSGELSIGWRCQENTERIL